MSTITDLPASRRILNNADTTGNYTGEMDRRTRRETITWSVEWADLPRFLEVAYGLDQVIDLGSGVTITRKVPLKHPWFDIGMYAERVRWKGVGSDALVTESRPYSHAIVEVEFSFPEFDWEDGEPALRIRIRSSTEKVSNPGHLYHLSPSGEPIDADVAVTIGVYAIEITRFNVASLAAAQALFRGLTGKVSDADITIAGEVYPAGTLMLPSAEVELALSVFGAREQTLSYSVTYRSVGHNRGFGQSGWEDIVPPPHDTADLSPLFE